MTDAIDWESMEPDWRAGIVPVLQLSKQYGVSRAAIIKHFGKLGIERDLTAKIKAKTDAMVTQAAVTHEVTQNRLRVTENAIIDANARQNAHIITQQRGDLAELRAVELKLMAELATLSGNIELAHQIGEIMAAPDDAGIDKMNDAYFKVISLPSRVDMLKKLTEIREKRINLERKAFKLDDEKPENPFAELIKAIQGRSIGPGTFKDVEGEVLEHDD